MATQREMYTYDRRITERNIRQGRLSPREYENYLKTLEDVSHKAVEVSEPQPLEPRGAEQGGNEPPRSSTKE